MDEKLLIRMILQVMSELGSATLESVLIRLERWTGAMHGARAFQTARGLGWIEAEPGAGGGIGARYRLTQGGQDELVRGAVCSVDLADGAADLESRRTQSVSVQNVLDVCADFDRFGGASIQLAAWELDVDQTWLIGAWTQAINDGLLERSGSDRVDGDDEEFWSLTDRGRRMQATAQNRVSG